jgi:hypothetical protein
MSLEDYINKGADSDWVTLTGAYVDSDNRVDTQWVKNGQATGVKGLSYYPLRAGPEDKHPVKVFLDATNFLVTTPQILLMEGHGPPKDFDKGYGLNDRGMIAFLAAVPILFGLTFIGRRKRAA